jgi:hypothetical protein
MGGVVQHLSVAPLGGMPLTERGHVVRKGLRSRGGLRAQNVSVCRIGVGDAIVPAR